VTHELHHGRIGVRRDDLKSSVELAGPVASNPPIPGSRKERRDRALRIGPTRWSGALGQRHWRSSRGIEQRWPRLYFARDTAVKSTRGRRRALRARRLHPRRPHARLRVDLTVPAVRRLQAVVQARHSLRISKATSLSESRSDSALARPRRAGSRSGRERRIVRPLVRRMSWLAPETERHGRMPGEVGDLSVGVLEA
jgi:hypothetical protein